MSCYTEEKVTLIRLATLLCWNLASENLVSSYQQQRVCETAVKLHTRAQPSPPRSRMDLAEIEFLKIIY